MRDVDTEHTDRAAENITRTQLNPYGGVEWQPGLQQ
jgi:hypothetical protein